MTTLLELRKVCFSHAERVVLSELCLSLREGTMTALVGPNGVGKTTLLRIIAGALAPHSGDVLLEGAPISQLSRRQRSQRLALVPQELEMPFDFTVEQIVCQGRTPYLRFFSARTVEDQMAVEQALDLANVSALRSRIYNELSGGERQRVKIALGLAQRPSLLLLDEPTQNLDIGRQAELMSLLKSLSSEGITIFASMHDLHLVRDNFSEVHLITAGKALRSGIPDEILTPENLMDAFQCTSDGHPMLAGARRSQEATWSL